MQNILAWRNSAEMKWRMRRRWQTKSAASKKMQWRRRGGSSAAKMKIIGENMLQSSSAATSAEGIVIEASASQRQAKMKAIGNEYGGAGAARNENIMAASAKA